VNIPFTVEQFLEVFKNYNLAIWPIQIIAYVIGAIALILAVKKTGQSDRIISGILSVFWLWMGIVYHIMYFSPINKPAYVFGAIFIIQGILFAIVGGIRGRISFHLNSNIHSIVGGVFILYAMVVYPIIGYLLGHGYPNSPGFGVAPCPTTIFTFGLLLWTDKRFLKYLLIIPLIWSAIGFSAALKLGIREDIGLLVAGVVGTSMIIFRDRSNRASDAQV
jgi:hypothetical protein